MRIDSYTRRAAHAMIILNEKQPPPPYASSPPPSTSSGPPPPDQFRAVPKLDGLPPNILLHIVNLVFPTTTVDATIHRKILYWLAMSLRLVSRGLYIACMHTLRSAYVTSYARLVRPPYTSDPFAAAPPPDPSSPVLAYGNRETRVLDLYIALKVREDVWMDETELHLERDECFKDLFDLMQPRSRTEDLVLQYGAEANLITVAAPAPTKRSVTPIPFANLTVNLSPRTLGIVLFSGGLKRTIVECYRERGETLEVGAKRLVRELAKWSRA
ncbi:hypothetical protein JB92DRAFT_2946459 [Gautieria morchelliformis]|nr:hypothetical protein JB92DRAFT_2946459 [Gautieria morchelliformis]